MVAKLAATKRERCYRQQEQLQDRSKHRMQLVEFGSSDRVLAKTPPTSLDCMGVTDDRTALAPVPVPGRGQPGHSLLPHAYPLREGPAQG